MQLSKETIVLAGLDILNKDEDLNMRKLADSLDIKAASIYWYFKNKQELVNEIAVYLYDQVVIPSDLHGLEYLKSFCVNEYDVFSVNMKALHYLYKNPPTTGIGVEFASNIIKEIMSFGYSVYDAMSVLDMLHHYVMYSVSHNRMDEYELFYANQIISNIDSSKLVKPNELEKLCSGKQKFLKFLDLMLLSIVENKKHK
ncbi:TetR/AcrR family transcriptional regulator [Apilactobacillus ozensis]|uniref:HTH tetR-type domain-containing protein n=1 Tax=Apilactobacillus ozensis DSM 23829 = JCM 17196 TaxID=1423781 RepID=A0A0R2AS16_9LACO|nr:TetR/AcrR family transcriptional regulator [Apilactobacillus ozensis]KRM68436.1 hypothetical protein FD06_GL001086 [Apilactobacillus ozensis DSM 23829 = JCM 17196]MCK8607471.1 TetR/AcrR family transcriptional regulator [Apilactobacillus ozensis]